MEEIRAEINNPVHNSINESIPRIYKFLCSKLTRANALRISPGQPSRVYPNFPIMASAISAYSFPVSLSAL